MINWEFVSHLSGAKAHVKVLRAHHKGKGLQCEIVTPVDEHRNFGTGKPYYFIDGDEKEFGTEEELIKALEGDFNMETKLLNAGHIELLEHMGGDEAAIRNARICWKSEDKSNPKADVNLIKNLLVKRHMTPFEAMVFTFEVKCPLFVARQWMRHRMGSFNEESLRYCVAEGEFYVPSVLPLGTRNQWEADVDDALGSYKWFIDKGLSKEQARALLPVGIYTKFYWTVNGSSLMNFLRLRTDKGAQAEIRAYAEEILKLVKQVAPITFKTFEEEILNG